MTSANEVRRHVDRLIGSKAFEKSERLGQLLRFTVERTLEGGSETLKESVIGVEVFQRQPGYDPKLDSVVRTSATRLRSKLLEYYSTEGQNDAVRIEYPKGSYVPIIKASKIGQPALHRLWVALAIACFAIIAVGARFAWNRHGVDAVLEGSLRLSGDTIRLTGSVESN